MSHLKKLVREKVSDNLEKKQNVKKSVAFDPTIILTIMQVIMTLIQDCDLFNRKPEDVQNRLKKLGPFERWALRSQVRAAIDDNRMFKLYGAQIVNSLIEVGPSLTAEDIKTTIEEVVGPNDEHDVEVVE